MNAIDAGTPLAAFAAGLATSLHCAVMCGPLACAMRVKPAGYHLSRLLSYTLAGALCGALGQSAAGLFKSDLARLAPWTLAIVLIVLGLGLEKRLPQPRWMAAVLLKVRLRGGLGFITPLLPCGPLWLMLGVAVIAGTWHGGALLLGSFALGTVPLYWLFQSQFFRLQNRFGPAALRVSQQGLAFVSAALLIWRALLPIHGSCH